MRRRKARPGPRSSGGTGVDQRAAAAILHAVMRHGIEHLDDRRVTVTRSRVAITTTPTWCGRDRSDGSRSIRRSRLRNYRFATESECDFHEERREVGAVRLAVAQLGCVALGERQ